MKDAEQGVRYALKTVLNDVRFATVPSHAQVPSKSTDPCISNELIVTASVAHSQRRLPQVAVSSRTPVPPTVLPSMVVKRHTSMKEQKE